MRERTPRLTHACHLSSDLLTGLGRQLVEQVHTCHHVECVVIGRHVLCSCLS